MIEKIYTVYDKKGGAHQMTWANASDMRRNQGWTMEPGTIVHPKPFGVALAKTEAKQAEQVTIVEIVPPAVSTNPYDGLTKDILQSAANMMKITYDRRWSEKRTAGAIEAVLDDRLFESGDNDGREEVSEDDSEAEKVVKTAATDARRMRAYKLEAEAHSFAWDEENPPTIAEVVKALAGL